MIFLDWTDVGPPFSSMTLATCFCQQQNAADDRKKSRQWTELQNCSDLKKARHMIREKRGTDGH
jgi:hypothetical protein